MPQARALKSFSGRYGDIQMGQIFNCETGYFNDLKKNGLVTEFREPGPSQNASIPAAPVTSGKVRAVRQSGTPVATETPPVAGKALTSASLPRGPVSRAKTLRQSVSGAVKNRKTKTTSKPLPLVPESTPEDTPQDLLPDE